MDSPLQMSAIRLQGGATKPVFHVTFIPEQRFSPILYDLDAGHEPLQNSIWCATKRTIPGGFVHGPTSCWASNLSARLARCTCTVHCHCHRHLVLPGLLCLEHGSRAPQSRTQRQFFVPNLNSDLCPRDWRKGRNTLLPIAVAVYNLSKGGIRSLASRPLSAEAFDLFIDKLPTKELP